MKVISEKRIERLIRYLHFIPFLGQKYVTRFIIENNPMISSIIRIVFLLVVNQYVTIYSEIVRVGRTCVDIYNTG